MKRYDIDIDYLVREYGSGKSAKKIASELGVSDIVIYNRLKKAGVELRPSGPERLTLAQADIDAYVAGESEKSISDRIGRSRRAIRRCLIDAGVRIRSQSEAEALKWQGMTDEQRAAQVAAAHEAARGSDHSIEHRTKIARARQEKRSGLSWNEIELHAMLSSRGILDIIPQQAIGPYNCDLGSFPVAVEVWGGHWHWHGRHLARVEERFRYVLNAGWHILVVPITRNDPLTDAVADYVASYIKEARRNPSARREYRVIWSAGEFSTAGSADDDEITVVPPFRRGGDVSRRKHTRAAR